MSKSKRRPLEVLSEVGEPTIKVASEAITVIDIVESIFTTNLFGWYAVGRELLRELREVVRHIGTMHNMQCMKSIEGGYLITYSDSTSAELGAIHAMDASLALLDYLNVRNQDPATPRERVMNIRIAIHFGQVDVVENDREGPNISLTLRLEGVTRESLQTAIDPIPADELPLHNYVLYSESVKNIFERQRYTIDPIRLGLLRLMGFPGWHEVYLTQRSVRAGS